MSDHYLVETKLKVKTRFEGKERGRGGGCIRKLRKSRRLWMRERWEMEEVWVFFNYTILGMREKYVK